MPRCRPGWWSAPTGVRSRMARAVGARRPGRAIRRDAALSTPTSTGLDADGFEFHLADRALAGRLPHPRRTRPASGSARPTATGWPASAGAGKAAALVAADQAGRARSSASGCGRARLTSRCRGGSRPAQHRSGRPAGPGWALVGDAGYHRDPITGHGITDAFRDAELLAAAADAWLCGEAGRADALAATRDAARPGHPRDLPTSPARLAEFPAPTGSSRCRSRLSRGPRRARPHELAASAAPAVLAGGPRGLAPAGGTRRRPDPSDATTRTPTPPERTSS